MNTNNKAHLEERRKMWGSIWWVERVQQDARLRNLVDVTLFDGPQDPRYLAALKALDKHLRCLYRMLMDLNAVASSPDAKAVEDNVNMLGATQVLNDYLDDLCNVKNLKKD